MNLGPLAADPIHERRLIPLEGGRNFRDLGGYLTSDGRRVKWRKLFRSGSMAGLTAADYGSLSSLSIKIVCDLRTAQEIEAELSTPKMARAAMIQGYRRLPFEQVPAHRELFRRLAAGDVPLVFNCSAGKDRAGTAAALILSALGVLRDALGITDEVSYAIRQSLLG